MRTDVARVTPHVTWLDRRRHARAVLELDLAAARDPRRVYGTRDGRPFFLKELVDFMLRGAGLVVTAGPKGAVAGFCLYAVTKGEIDVERYVCPPGPPDAALQAALELTRANCGRAAVLYPVIVDLS